MSGFNNVTYFSELKITHIYIYIYPFIYITYIIYINFKNLYLINSKISLR